MRKYLPDPLSSDLARLYRLSTLALLGALSLGPTVGQTSPQQVFEPESEVSIQYRLYGLNFSPYSALDEDPNLGGSQITPEELESRLAAVAPFTRRIRTFGCNDDLRETGRLAHEMGLETAIGAWIGTDEVENQRQIDCLVSEALEGHVDLAIVGSEAVFRGDQSSEALVERIVEVQDALAAAGLDVPVTTGETWAVWLDHPNLLASVDEVFVNIYGYWEMISIDEALEQIQTRYAEVSAAANGKPVLISETGWPSCGNAQGDAVPSIENAQRYFEEVVSWARAEGLGFFWFSALEEAWKMNYEGPQGACWGLFTGDLVRNPWTTNVFNGELAPLPAKAEGDAFDVLHSVDSLRLEDSWFEADEVPLVSFASQPDLITTPLANYFISGATDVGSLVELEGVGALVVDEDGFYLQAIELLQGDNQLNVTITSFAGETSVIEKTVRYTPGFDIASSELLYIESVAEELDGSILLDVDKQLILGYLPGLYIRGVHPTDERVFFADGTVLSSVTHEVLVPLPILSSMSRNGVIVSRDGTRLYSGTEVVDLVNNVALEPLPISIRTGSSYNSAATPGGPAMTQGGETIFCCSSQQGLTEVRPFDVPVTAETISLPTSERWQADLTVAPRNAYLARVTYQGQTNFVLTFYNTRTFSELGRVTLTGDFSGELVTSQSDGRFAVVGAAGNPASANGGLSVIDTETFTRVGPRLEIDLADQLVISAEDRIYASSATVEGIEVFDLDDKSGALTPKTSYVLGIGRWAGRASSTPRDDDIRRLVLKPRTTLFSDGFDDGTTDSWSETRGQVEVTAPGFVGTQFAAEFPLEKSTTQHFVEAKWPTGRQTLAVDFRFNPTQAEIGNAAIEVLRIPGRVLQVKLKKNRLGDYKLRVFSYDNEGTKSFLGKIAVGASSPSQVEVRWFATSGSDGEADGRVVVLRNGNEQLEVSGLDTHTLEASSVRLGLPGGTEELEQTASVLRFDEVVIRP